MAQITFNVPDAQATRVLNALASYYGWVEGNPLTKLEFVRGKLIELFVSLVKDAEVNNARNQATVDTINNFVDPNIT